MIKIQGYNKIEPTCGSKKEEEFIIFLDLDGVISNWIKATTELLDIEITDDLRDKLKAGEYLDNTGVITEKEMWDKITEAGSEFWSEMELYPWSHKLIDEMEKLGTVYFLTSPGSCVPAPSGKMAWIKEHFGDEYVKKLIICKDKFRLATSNSVLIDDTDKKIEAFKEKGKVFHWPNDLALQDGDIDVDETIEELKEKIKGWKK